MTDKELLYIKTIMEERNISSAARRLYMTQPALSHSLRMLEQEIGEKLFVRTAGGVEPTYTGECYYEMAVEILEIYAAGRQKLMDVVQSKKGRVRIGMTRYISTLILPHILPRFYERYPNIEIQLSELNSSELEGMVGAKKLDFAIIHRDNFYAEAKGSEGELCALSYEELFRDDFVVIASKRSEIGKTAKRLTGYLYPVLELKELDGCKMILENKKHRMRRVANGIMKRANVTPQIVLETELFETAQRLAREGLGVTIVNGQYLDFMDLSECKIFSIPKKYKPYWMMTIVIPARGYIPSIAKQLMEMIREYAENWDRN